MLVAQDDRVADRGRDGLAVPDVQRQARPAKPRAELPAAQERRQPARTRQQVGRLAHGCFTAYCWHEYQHAAPHRGAHPDRPGPGQLKWILLARESTLRERQLDHQLTDLRARVATIGGMVDREIPENAVSAFKRKRVQLPDGTFGFRVVRPEWEKILTALRRGECNALMVPDIHRATRDPRTLEDLIDAVELYGLYVASLTGNIDLTTDAGISAARGLVNQRNQESRNTSRRVANGQWHAALKGGNHGGKNRPYGWRKDRIHLSKREAGHIRQEIPRILAGSGRSRWRANEMNAGFPRSPEAHGKRQQSRISSPGRVSPGMWCIRARSFTARTGIGSGDNGSQS